MLAVLEDPFVVDDTTYPTFFHAVYESLLTTKHARQRVRSLHLLSDIRAVMDAEFDREQKQRMKEAVYDAYTRILQNTTWTLPTSSISLKEPHQVKMSRYTLCWGRDAPGYGWDIIGCALTGTPRCDDKTLYMIYRVARALHQRMLQGDRLASCIGKTVVELFSEFFQDPDDQGLGSFVRKWRQGRTDDYHVILQEELLYPASLVHLVKRYFAPTINNHFQDCIDQELLRAVQHVYCLYNDKNPVFQISLTQKIRHNLRVLLKQNKLPLDKLVLDKVQLWTSLMWSQDEISDAMRFIPKRSMSPDVLVVSAHGHPFLSPLTPTRALTDGDFVFQHVFEYVYYRLLRPFLSRDDAFRRARQIKNWRSDERDKMLNAVLCQHVKQKTQELFSLWLSQDPLRKWAVLTSSDGIHLYWDDVVLKTTLDDLVKTCRHDIAASITHIVKKCQGKVSLKDFIEAQVSLHK